MVEVFFRSLPDSIHLVLSELPADADTGPAPGKVLQLGDGKFWLVLAGKPLTKASTLRNITFKAVAEGNRWVLDELHARRGTVDCKLADDAEFGLPTGPRLVFARTVGIVKLPESVEAVTAASAFAHAAGWKGALPDFGTQGQPDFRIDWGSRARKPMTLRDEQARFVAVDGALELDLGQTDGNIHQPWVNLRAPSGHEMSSSRDFRAAFRFLARDRFAFVCRYDRGHSQSHFVNPGKAPVELHSKDTRKAQLHSLEMANGWVRGRFFPADMELALVSRAVPAVGTDPDREPKDHTIACASGQAEGFAAVFAWDGREDSGAPAQNTITQALLLHSADQAQADGDPYTGLELAGLWDRRGAPLRLASQCAVALSEADGDWQFRAGQGALALLPQDMPAEWKPDQAALRIKPDVADGVRRAEVVASETAFLSLLQDSEDAITLTLAAGPQYWWSGDIGLPVTRLSAAPLDLVAENRDLGTYAYWDLVRDGSAFPPFPVTLRGVDLPAQLFDHLQTPLHPRYDLARNATQQVDLRQTRLGVTDGRLSGYDRAAIALFDRDDPFAQEVPDNPEPAIAKPKHWLVSPRDMYVIQDGVPAAALHPNAGIGRLRYIASEKQLGTSFSAEAQRLALSCLPGAQPPLQDIGSITLEVKSGFGLALARRITTDREDRLEFWDALSEPAVAMVDLSVFDDDGGQQGMVLGYDAGEWGDLRRKLTFAFGNGALDQALTPFDPKFQGHVFRGLKLNFPGRAADAMAKFPAIESLYRALQDWPTVNLAWHDARGWSLYLEVVKGGQSLLDLSFLKVWLESFFLVVHGGKLLAARAGITAEVPFLAEEGSDKPARFTLEGQFKYDKAKLLFNGAELGTGAPLKTFEFAPGNMAGLKAIDIDKVGTDLKTLTIKGKLHFAEAIALLGNNFTLPVTLILPMAADASARIEAKLEEAEPRTAAGWSLSITSLAIAFDKGQPVSTTLGGSLSLGLDGFLAVGFTITVVGTEAKLAINRFEGQLGIGDFTARLDLKLEGDELQGGLVLKSGLTGAVELSARIWNTDKETSWIAVLGGVQGTGEGGKNGAINAERFILQDARLALGRRASIGGKDTMLRALEDPTATSVIEAISAKGLGKWQADPTTDLVIGAAGKLGLDKTWFASGSKPSGIMLTTGGLFRVSAHSRFLKALEVDYDLTLDMRRQFIFAGFQLPATDPLQDDPDPARAKNSSFKVSGGYAGLGLSWGKDKLFAITLGWPYASLLDPDLGAPVWSRAVTVYWSEAFPINTFQGGVMFATTGSGHTIGIALRAGWTWRYKAEKFKLEASASLGIMVGGVLQLTLGNATVALPPGELARAIRLLDPAPRPDSRSASGALLAKGLLDQLDVMLGSLVDTVDVHVKSGLYLDAWGSAQVKFFGITLVGVRIDAHAQVIILATNGTIKRAYAKATFSVRVKIGCKTYKTTAYFQIDFVKATSSLTAMQLAAPPLLAVLPAPRAVKGVAA